MDEIKLVKLVSGEELIAGYSEENDVLQLENPVQVSMVPARGGQPSFGFLPFPLSAKENKTIYIDKTHVLFICDSTDEIIEQYKSIFSGIAVPTKKLILN